MCRQTGSTASCRRVARPRRPSTIQGSVMRGEEHRGVEYPRRPDLATSRKPRRLDSCTSAGRHQLDADTLGRRPSNLTGRRGPGGDVVQDVRADVCPVGPHQCLGFGIDAHLCENGDALQIRKQAASLDQWSKVQIRAYAILKGDRQTVATLRSHLCWSWIHPPSLRSGQRLDPRRQLTRLHAVPGIRQIARVAQESTTSPFWLGSGNDLA